MNLYLVKIQPCSTIEAKDAMEELVLLSLSEVISYIYTLKKNNNLFLAVLCGLQDLGSQTKEQSSAPCSRSTESWPLDCQGITET